MKKIIILLFVVMTLFALASCSNGKTKLYFLNWDEYVDESLLEKFEEQYNCKVVMEIAESCEIMYSRIASNSADYDIATPSDYMIHQMAKEGMLYEIDFSMLENYYVKDDDGNPTSETKLVPELQNLINNNCIDKDSFDYRNYFVPYFWGSLGIMYNTDMISEEEFNQHVSELALQGLNAWNMLFLKEYESEIGMYATSRDSIACALMSMGRSLNTDEKEINQETGLTYLEEAENKLKSMNYKAWATDDLKVGVPGGKYMMTLDYSGSYIDALYSLDSPSEANFKMYVPHDINNVFFDAMVIPKTSKNYELALKFIDFMIDSEVSEEDYELYGEDAVSNSLANADAVGYCPTINDVYLEIIDSLNDPSDEIYPEEDSYDGIADTDAYFPGDADMNGEVYQYLGKETFNAYEEAFKRIKSGTDEEEENTSGYILLAVMTILVGSVFGYSFYLKKNKH